MQAAEECEQELEGAFQGSLFVFSFQCSGRNRGGVFRRRPV